MLEGEHFHGLFLIKIIFGLLAVFFNLVCVYAVCKRRRCSVAGDREGMRSVGTAMKLGSGVVPTFLVAFALGAYFALH